MEISPMLLTEVEDDTILDKGWIYAEKINGVRAIIHVKGGKIVGIRGRNNNPLLYCFPELKEATFNFDTAILDAECACLIGEGGKSVFYSGIDRRRSAPDAKRLREYPVTAVVFDIIQYEQEVLINKPYKTRLEYLEKIKDKIHGSIQILETTTDGRALWEKVVRENREGCVIRDPNGLYELGVRSKIGCRKLKNYKHVDVIVEKTELNAKGTKIYSNVVIDGVNIIVEAQQGGCFSINVEDKIRVKYLDIVGDRMIQPTRF